MIEETAARCIGEHFTDPIIITHIDYKNHIKNLNINSLETLYETERKNTAPAIAMAINYVGMNYPYHPLLFLPCDHDISDHALFQKMIISADPNHLTVFGKRPTHAETNYGYIDSALSGTVIKFHEKPNEKTAKEYLQSKNMFWNMGIFYGLTRCV